MKDKKVIYLDEEGREKYEAELSELEGKLKGRIVTVPTSNEATTNHGWDDNPDANDFNRIHSEISSRYDKLKRANGIVSEIVDIKKHNIQDSIDVGDWFAVRLAFPDGRKETHYATLVARFEVKTDEIGLTNLNCPLGTAVYKKKLGDPIEYGPEGKKVKGIIMDMTKEEEKTDKLVRVKEQAV